MIRLTWRSFTTRNTVIAGYNELVRSGKIRADPNQMAVVKVLDEWTDKFYASQPRLVQYKQTYEKIADFGQNAKAFR